MNKHFKNRHKTNHLSPEENTELMERYYAGKNIIQLIEEYSIDIPPRKISSTFQLTKTSEQICKFCKSEMYYVPPSRNFLHRKEYICKTCYHREGILDCECRNCIAKKQDEADKKRTLNKQKLAIESDAEDNLLMLEKAISDEDLSIRERVYLGALLRCIPLTQNYLFVLDKTQTNNLAPTMPYSNIILETLISRGIIFEVSTSSLSSKFAVNIKNISIDKKILFDLMYPKQMEDVDIELFEIIRDIQTYESIEYFSHTLERFNLPNFLQDQIQNKFFLLFRRMLMSGYSTAQLLNFIYSAIRNTAANNNCSVQNMELLSEIYRCLSNRYNVALADSWTIKNYNRAYQQEVSELFKLISNDLLGIGETLFYEAYNLENKGITYD